MKRPRTHARAATVLGLLALPAVANAQPAAETPRRELDVDVDAYSVTVSMATRVSPHVSVGAGMGGGLSPILGTTYARGSHYDDAPNAALLDVAGAQGFARFDLRPWLHVDTGLRAGIFIHGRENFSGGEYLAAYVMPSVGWRWVWVGPRLSAGWLHEKEPGTAGALSLDFLIVRFAMVTKPR